MISYFVAIRSRVDVCGLYTEDKCEDIKIRDGEVGGEEGEERKEVWGGLEEVRLGRALYYLLAGCNKYLGEEKGPDHHGIPFPFPISHFLTS
jgi:hypothetical protein